MEWLPHPFGLVLIFFRLLVGALPFSGPWEPLILVFHPILCAAGAWEYGVTQGKEHVLRRLGNVPRESRMDSLGELFDLHRVDPTEFRHEPAAMFDPPREGLDGVWQDVRQELAATHDLLEPLDWARDRQQLRDVRGPLREAHDERYLDIRYDFLGYARASALVEMEDKGVQTESTGVQTSLRKRPSGTVSAAPD